jgi:hypothetical protein
MLFMESMRVKTPQEIAQENLAKGTTIKPIPENVFQKMAGGARTAGEFVNRAGTAADVAKLFPGYTGQSTVNIPTSFNFAPKQAPTGEIIPGGLQTQPVQVNQLLQAIKPSDVLGISGAERAYTDVGLGKAPQPLDVLDVAGLGAIGYGAGKTALKATKGVPVGLSIQETKGLLETAPKSDIGFYSAVEQAALATPRKSGTGQAFLNDISKGQDVRADEIKWMGLDDFLKGKQNVTRQEVQDYIANNRVDVQEVKSTIPRLPGEEMPGDEGAFLPKFGQYTLPGGENYRELLLTMPNTKAAKLDARRAEIEAKGVNATDADRNEWASIMNQLQPETRDIEGISRFRGMPDYQSPHFPQKNVLAHLRVNDRVDADGKKMLLIEEVQSDWHQAGRDKGYASEAKPSTFVLKNPETGGSVGNFATREEAAEFMRTSPRADEFAQKQFVIDEIPGKRSGVPDAPFKDTWYQLALKRAIQHAAENGYDRIGLTTGARQAERFDLSKQVNKIDVEAVDEVPNLYFVDVDVVGGQRMNLEVENGIVRNDEFQGKPLRDVVGKEIADKILGVERGNMQRFEGDDLRIGGEGMKKYYDEIYPKFLDKYGKKWGARVGETNLNVVGKMKADPEVSKHPQYAQMLSEELGGKNPLDVSDDDFWKAYTKVSEKITGKKVGETVRYIDITPEMKAGVSKGQPLFMAAPIGAGLLGSESMTPER